MRILNISAILGLLAVAGCGFGPELISEAHADSQVSNTNYRCGMRGPYYGRTDAICVDTVQKGLVAVGNGDVVTTLNKYLWVEDFIDFLGQGDDLPTTGDTVVNTASPWFIHDTSSSGSPTHAAVADADHGLMEFTLASTSEAEYVELHWNDEQNIDTDQDPVVVFRLQVDVMPTTNDDLVFGLASARNNTLDTVANNAWFRLAASSSLLVESDDGTTNDDDNDTGIDITADQFYEFKVDCTDPTDCDFFYRTTLGGDWTEVLATTAFSIGAAAQVQPFIALHKSTGSSVPSIDIDYVHTIWKRD